MNTPSIPAQRDLPTPFAERLRSLRDVDNALLNALLAACRDQGWPTPALARGLDMNAPAVSKRIQRARKHQADARAARQTRRAARHGAPLAAAAWAARQTQITDYERVRAQVAREQVPAFEKIHAMADGRRLDRATVTQLQAWQQISSRVRGSTPADSEDREISKKLSALLHQLIEEQGFTAYYLSQELNVSPRAITSRLERHQHRDPCPSVAGTSSGTYFGRKIGDPGAGAPRLGHQPRQQLRTSWARYRSADNPRTREQARLELISQLREYLAQDFTLANLAQAMSTGGCRVRFNELRAAFAASGQETS